MRFRYTLSSTYSGSLVLTKDPKGWESMETIIKRGAQYHGTFYETMVQLQFTCGAGKEYIDNIYEAYGVDALVNILIEINCGGGVGSIDAPDYSDDYSDDYGSIITGSGAAVYETFFEGTLDFSKYNKTTRSTFVDLLQSDFIQKTINRFETKVELTKDEDLDGNTLTQLALSTITLPSKTIQYGTSLELDETAQADTIDFPDISDSYATFYIYHPFGIIFDDLGAFPITPVIESFDSVTQHPQALFIAPFTGTYNISYSFIGSMTIQHYDDSTVTYVFELKYGVSETGGGSTVIGSSFGQIFTPNSTHTLDFSFTGNLTVNMVEGDEFQFYFRNSSGASFHIDFHLDYTTCDFNANINTETVASDCDTFLVHEAGAAIAQRITGLEDCFRSDLLGRTNSMPNDYVDNGCMSFMAITCGKKIRRMPTAKSPIFMSMAEYFNTINAIGNVGLGFEKIGTQYYIRIEEKEYFYSLTSLMQCPYANEIKTTVAKDYFVSDIEIGYDKWENEEVNGLDEFNTKQNYNTGIKSIESRRLLLSPLIASAYAIEFTRRKKYSNFPNLDWKYDNDNFIICLNRSVDAYNNPTDLDTVELDENYSQINNVLDSETGYNYRISPKRNLLRHLSVINGSLTKYVNRLIKFVYGEGNYFMSSEFTADTCAGNFDNELLEEDQDIDSTAVGIDPIWIPEYIEFEYPMGFSTFLTIKNSPYGCIEVSNSDTGFVKGYIIELRYKPVGGMASFKLLRAFEA